MKGACQHFQRVAPLWVSTPNLSSPVIHTQFLALCLKKTAGLFPSPCVTHLSLGVLPLLLRQSLPLLPASVGVGACEDGAIGEGGMAMSGRCTHSQAHRRRAAGTSCRMDKTHSMRDRDSGAQVEQEENNRTVSCGVMLVGWYAWERISHENLPSCAGQWTI